jgi:Tol biopolymer transport system component
MGHVIKRPAQLSAGLAAAMFLAACAGSDSPAVERVPEPDEPFFASLKQLTFGGQNAEAYFSPDGSQLIFQRQDEDRACDQQFVINVDGSGLRRVSNGLGRTTCGYFYDDGDRILYSSTFHVDSACPPPPDRSQGYVWPLDEYDIYTSLPDGSDLRQLTDTPGYDAEATLSPDGERIVFTSVRNGDLDIYAMDLDGGNVQQLTTTPGYDGGPFFSPDGSMIVYRAYHPDGEELADYQRVLADGLVRPGQLEVWVMNADGTNQRQVTNLGGANFAPFFHPDSRRIIFSSNHSDPRGREFDIYLINLDGTGLMRVTTRAEFDGFPMFSPDGKQLVFASNRFGSVTGETNVFIAEWVEP